MQHPGIHHVQQASLRAAVDRGNERQRCYGPGRCAREGEKLNFSQAVILAPEGLGKVEEKAVTVLREEVRKRTGIELSRVTHWPDSGLVIAVGLQSQAKTFAGPLAAAFEAVRIPGPEGFALAVQRQPRSAVMVCATDARGLLYGVGRSLRKMELLPGSISIPADLQVTTAPKYELRGHQLGYRPKVNAYDAWSPAQFDQYIRELALFGANSIEIMPPRTDDQRTSPHMKVPPLEMMVRLSEIIDSYGLDVWILVSEHGQGLCDRNRYPGGTGRAGRVFRQLKRIDHILVPGGDPGNLHPDVFFPWLDKMAAVLHKYHPRRQNLGLAAGLRTDPAWLDFFYRPRESEAGLAWRSRLCAVVPHAAGGDAGIVDREIKIRNYPDITHNVDCQFPVRIWDLAFALTLHRECYNPRPLAMKTIQNVSRLHLRFALVFRRHQRRREQVRLGRSGLGSFDAGDRNIARLLSVVHQPCRWRRNSPGTSGAGKELGGAAGRQSPGRGHARTMAGTGEDVHAGCEGGYRFQMGLLRAYYDAYVKRRLIRETELEAKATEALRRTRPARGPWLRCRERRPSFDS